MKGVRGPPLATPLDGALILSRDPRDALRGQPSDAVGELVRPAGES